MAWISSLLAASAITVVEELEIVTFRATPSCSTLVFSTVDQDLWIDIQPLDKRNMHKQIIKQPLDLTSKFKLEN
jgi:hypothetical protein